MTKRKRRVDKKIHRHWLELELIDLSCISYWRKLLFESKEHVEFDIDSNNLTEVHGDLRKVIVKYRLQYKVAKVPSNETDPWLSNNGNIIFKFWAKNYPSVKAYTGNNPKII